MHVLPSSAKLLPYRRRDVKWDSRKSSGTTYRATIILGMLNICPALAKPYQAQFSHFRDPGCFEQPKRLRGSASERH